MDRARLLSHFDTLAATPDAVAKLRALVLNLAVRGQLVPSAAKDEASGSWKQLIAEPGLESPLFETPDHWHWTTLDRVAAPCGQKVPDRRFTYIDVGAIDNVRGLIKEAPAVLSAEEAPSRARKLVEPQTVIFSTVRPYLRNIAIVDRDFLPAPIVSTAFAVLHPKAFLDPQFLFHWLRGEPFQEVVSSKMKGMAYPAISDSEFWTCPIPLPPLAEQKRIVARVEELLALCDELEARQTDAREQRTRLVQSAFDHLTAAHDDSEFREHSAFCLQHSDLLFDSVPALRQAILSLAVQGHLVPHIKAEGTGAEVTERFSLKEHVSAGHDSVAVFPQHWASAAFANFARIRSGVTKGRNLTGRKLSTYPYLRVANVQRGFLDLEVMKDLQIPTEELEKYRLETGDLLITEGGDWDKVGRTAIWRGEIANCIHQNHVFRARLVSPSLKPDWFMLYLNSPVGRSYFEAAAKQTTNLASINATELRGCPIPIPPLAEQQRIVAKVAALMRWCDELEARLAAAQNAAAALLDSSLHALLTD